MTTRLATLAVLAASTASCDKVPLIETESRFSVADAAWFDEEDTLFLFWRVEAEQGVGDQSVIEVRYRFANERIDWTPVSDLPTLHSHATVDCGAFAQCGSTSLRLPTEPDQVDMRLRYHPDGELVLFAATVLNVVGPGPAHSHRSLLVYGVFDETNATVQWRARHNFPTLRNGDVEQFGLRRYVAINDMATGTAELAGGRNIYGYGVTCPEAFEDAGLGFVETRSRAVFHPEPLPAAMGEAAVVCANATVIDGTGTFTTGAIARKNPEVRPAFPGLNSPVEDATPLKFMLGPCDVDPVSDAHEAMQRQRLQLQDVPTTCTDDAHAPGFVESLVATFQGAVDAERPSGNDMVLVIAVNQDDPAVSLAVEEALLDVVPSERHRSSPRVAGAFVFDSTPRGLTEPTLAASTLWCPSTEGEADGDISCPPQPDTPNVDLGPVQISELPILPDRDQYLTFLETFSPNQGGAVESLTYRVPRFAGTTEHLDVGRFGVMTFLNHESVAADSDDAFSFCAQVQSSPVMFSSPSMRDPSVRDDILEACGAEELPDAICETIRDGAVRASGMPKWHALFGEDTYRLGIRWDFPFLLRMEYRTVVAGGATVLGFSVPFGAASPHNEYYGSDTWLRETFRLERTLLQCRRFCDHPTFDSAGVYHPTEPFRSTYAETCYAPVFPTPLDFGSPLDP